MLEALLDRTLDGAVPPGYLVIDSEIAFLTNALTESALYIRGNGLCDWAEAFFQGRQFPYRETKSPITALMAICPSLDRENARLVSDAIGNRWSRLNAHLTVTAVLEVLYPTSMWSTMPSNVHAAQWLLWLYQNRPLSWLIALLRDLSEQWLQTVEPPLDRLYVAHDGEAAEKLLHQWLQIEPSELPRAVGTFPIDVPNKLIATAKKVWNEQIILSKGNAFETLINSHIPTALKQVTINETLGYYRVHTGELDQKHFDDLAIYLDPTQQADLRKHLPPPIPTKPPREAQFVIDWFVKEYQPFRLWQVSNVNSDADRVVQELAHEFGRWYLEAYPRALTGHPMHSLLSFERTRGLCDRNDVSTLVVVLDGLPVRDAERLQRTLQASEPRLTTLSVQPSFCPIPTVTEFCKEALFCGVPSSHVEHAKRVGIVLPENRLPIQELAKVERGNLYLWRVMQPDTTYHDRNNFETLRRDVEAELDGIAMKIRDIVQYVPDEIPLRLVITTDHGRILDKADRTLAIPNGMMSHGRAAWGDVQITFPECGYIINGEIALLHGQTYGLPVPAAVVLGPSAFKTNDGKGGSEKYPHGGLYPEEVIVPWIELARDFTMPALIVTVSGTGVAGIKGDVHIAIVNPGDVALSSIKLQLQVPGASPAVLQIVGSAGPRSRTDFVTNLSVWPSREGLNGMTGVLTLRMPDGKIMDVSVELQLQTEEMYKQDNILDDLDLGF